MGSPLSIPEEDDNHSCGSLCPGQCYAKCSSVNLLSWIDSLTNYYYHGTSGSPSQSTKPAGGSSSSNSSATTSVAIQSSTTGGNATSSSHVASTSGTTGSEGVTTSGSSWNSEQSSSSSLYRSNTKASTQIVSTTVSVGTPGTGTLTGLPIPPTTGQSASDVFVTTLPTFSIEPSTYTTITSGPSGIRTITVTTSHSVPVMETVTTTAVDYSSAELSSSSVSGPGVAAHAVASHRKSNTAAIVGGIIGALVALFLCLGLLWYRRRTRSKRSRDPVWFGPRAHSGATSMLLDHSTSNTSSLFLTAEGGTEEDSATASHQTAPSIHRYGATSQAAAEAVAFTHTNFANSTQPVNQPRSVQRPIQSLVAPTLPLAQPILTSTRLVVSEPLRSADIRAQDPDPFADPHSRSDTMVSIESPTINGPLPNAFLDPGLFPPKGRAAAWESQMDSARTSMLGPHGHAADLEIMRQSLLSDASAEALVEAGEAM